MHGFLAQFGKPNGLLGLLAGLFMARVNRRLNDWGISLLESGPSDHVLEVGFGPGLAIRRLAGIVTDGLIAGVDHSELMVRQAHRLNVTAIRAGKVILCLGSVSALPFGDNTFHRIFSAYSLPFWSEPIDCLQELHRVIKSHGRIVTALQPRRVNDGQRKEIAEKVLTQLASASFRDLHLEFKDIHPIPAMCLIGFK